MLDEILQERVSSSRGRRNRRGVRRKVSKFPIRPRNAEAPPKINLKEAIRIIK